MRTVLITGASGGIGAAAAAAFAKAGYKVAVHYHKNRRGALDALEGVKAAGGEGAVFSADVSKKEQVERLFWEIKAELGPVHCLVNNGGFAQSKVCTDITKQDWADMIGTHLSGAFYCCQAALPDMLAAKEGCILNVSSVWGVHGASCEVHYSAAKAGLIGLSMALAKELGPSGIRVNCVAPGVIETPMNAALTEETRQELRQQTPLGRFGTPEEVAALLVYMASDAAAFITGQTIGVDGGFQL